MESLKRCFISLALAAACALPLPAMACEYVLDEGEESHFSSLANATLLNYDAAAVAGVGTQSETGHTSCCLAFCEAYGDSMLFGRTIPHTDYAYYGNCLIDPCASNEGWRRTSYDATFAVYDIMENRPCILHVTDKRWASEHWVLVIGYQNVDDPVDATIANLIVLDPWDGAIIPATDRYARYGDYMIMHSSRNMSIPIAPTEPEPTHRHQYDQGFCTECNTKWGDLNQNGLVNVVDAQIAYDVAIGRYDSHEDADALLAHADVAGPNGTPDGFVDAQDAFAILRATLQ